MNTSDFSDLINRCLAVPDGEPLTPPDTDALRRLTVSMPWLSVPALLLLRHGGVSEQEAESLRKHLAAVCPDERTLAFAAHGDGWKHFYPKAELPAPQETNNVIDTFLNTYGSCTPEEEALLERMIFNPTPDYAEMLAREEQDNLPEPRPMTLSSSASMPLSSASIRRLVVPTLCRFPKKRRPRLPKSLLRLPSLPTTAF